MCSVDDSGEVRAIICVCLNSESGTGMGAGSCAGGNMKRVRGMGAEKKKVKPTGFKKRCPGTPL